MGPPIPRHDICHNVEYVGFERIEDGNQRLILIHPSKAFEYASETGDRITKIYWKTGKWSYGFGRGRRSSDLQSIWAGAGVENGVLLFSSPNA